MGDIAWGVVIWPVLAGFYLFLAGSFDGVEIAAAVACASAGAVISVATLKVTKKHFRLRASVGALSRPVLAIVPECARVGRELAAVALGTGGGRRRGDFVLQPFEPGANDPESAGRRSLAVIGISLAPRTYVIRGERENSLLLHGLPPKEPSADREWPT